MPFEITKAEGRRDECSSDETFFAPAFLVGDELYSVYKKPAMKDKLD
jgi:hypothetical protein